MKLVFQKHLVKSKTRRCRICGKYLVDTKGYEQTQFCSRKCMGIFNKSDAGGWTRKILPKKSYKISPPLCYILGVLKGDGNITKGVIQLETIDKEFILFFIYMIKKWCNMEITKIRTRKGVKNTIFGISICSIMATNFLKDFNIDNIINSNNQCKIMFLKGFIDSEGAIQKKSRTISITNCNKHLLFLCKKLLMNIDINTSNINISVRKGTLTPFGILQQNCYSLHICGQKNLIKFKRIIGFTIQRKQQALIKVCNSYLNSFQLNFLRRLPNADKNRWRELIHNGNISI